MDIKIENIQDLVNEVIDLNDEYSGQVWWRGQSESGNPLRPSLFRDSQYSQHEKTRIQCFIQRARIRHQTTHIREQKSDWLFLMQHYRLPTRLLDWTESPLVACFFAVDNLSTDGEIYAIYPYHLNKISTGIPCILLPDDNGPKELIENAFIGKIDINEIYAIRPPEIDSRMMMQLSVFTIHGSSKPLGEYQNKDMEIHRFTLPKEYKNRIQKQLKYLGTRESSLYPDLEHLADEIKTTKYKNKSNGASIINEHYMSDDTLSYGEPSS